MRGKKVAINAVAGIIEELLAIICGLVLPRLILVQFGSVYNGLVTSISQFLTCAVLMRSGIGGVTRAALYRTLADKDIEATSSVLNATKAFMKKVSAILALSIVAFACVYPFFLIDEFNWFFTCSLFLIIGLSTFAESFFGITYLILLQADQKIWISSAVRCVCYIFNLIITSLLIINGFSIHIVKLSTTLIFTLYPIALGVIVRKRYKINKYAIANNSVIAQRWDAFWHQIAVFVMDNSSVMVLTILSNIKEVSVFSVYNMVIYSLRRLIQSFTGGLGSAFGNMIAKKELNLLRRNYDVTEFAIFSISTVAFTCAGILILPFVSIYTAGVNDIQYIRPLFAYVFLFAQFMNSVRLPSQMVVEAAGHFKQTKKYVIIEPIINVLMSIVGVLAIGIDGVAFAAAIAITYRTVVFKRYTERVLLVRTQNLLYKRIFFAVVECGITVLVISLLPIKPPESYISWVLYALIVAFFSCASVFGCSFLFFHTEVRDTWLSVVNIIRRTKK